MAKINGIEEATDPVQEDGKWHVAGLTIMPQAQISKYRADFRIIHERKFKDRWEHQQVIVECDSQQFHERTEVERREKWGQRAILLMASMKKYSDPEFPANYRPLLLMIHGVNSTLEWSATVLKVLEPHFRCRLVRYRYFHTLWGPIKIKIPGRVEDRRNFL